MSEQHVHQHSPEAWTSGEFYEICDCGAVREKGKEWHACKLCVPTADSKSTAQ